MTPYPALHIPTTRHLYTSYTKIHINAFVTDKEMFMRTLFTCILLSSMTMVSSDKLGSKFLLGKHTSLRQRICAMHENNQKRQETLNNLSQDTSDLVPSVFQETICQYDNDITRELRSAYAKAAYPGTNWQCEVEDKIQEWYNRIVLRYQAGLMAYSQYKDDEKLTLLSPKTQKQVQSIQTAGWVLQRLDAIDHFLHNQPTHGNLAHMSSEQYQEIQTVRQRLHNDTQTLKVGLNKKLRQRQHDNYDYLNHVITCAQDFSHEYLSYTYNAIMRQFYILTCMLCIKNPTSGDIEIDTREISCNPE